MLHYLLVKKLMSLLLLLLQVIIKLLIIELSGINHPLGRCCPEDISCRLPAPAIPPYLRSESIHF